MTEPAKKLEDCRVKGFPCEHAFGDHAGCPTNRPMTPEDVVSVAVNDLGGKIVDITGPLWFALADDPEHRDFRADSDRYLILRLGDADIEEG